MGETEVLCSALTCSLKPQVVIDALCLVYVVRGGLWGAVPKSQVCCEVTAGELGGGVSRAILVQIKAREWTGQTRHRQTTAWGPFCTPLFI